MNEPTSDCSRKSLSLIPFRVSRSLLSISAAVCQLLRLTMNGRVWHWNQHMSKLCVRLECAAAYAKSLTHPAWPVRTHEVRLEDCINLAHASAEMPENLYMFMKHSMIQRSQIFFLVCKWMPQNHDVAFPQFPSPQVASARHSLQSPKVVTERYSSCLWMVSWHRASTMLLSNIFPNLRALTLCSQCLGRWGCSLMHHCPAAWRARPHRFGWPLEGTEGRWLVHQEIKSKVEQIKKSLKFRIQVVFQRSWQAFNWYISTRSALDFWVLWMRMFCGAKAVPNSNWRRHLVSFQSDFLIELLTYTTI